MDIRKFMSDPNEKPLDTIVSDGGFCSIFRTVACVGDSLSSGELEATNPHGGRVYLDFYEHSWGQYLARMCGSTVYNFSKGGMTAKQYVDSYADKMGFWDRDKACQCYIIALGVNDIINGVCPEVGTISDVHPKNRRENAKNFIGYYAAIISHYQEIQPDARFFLVTIPRDAENDPKAEQKQAVCQALYDLAAAFPNCYVIDLYKYGPIYDSEFRRHFHMGGHMSPTGYVLTAKMIASYIDYIIRNDPEDFKQVGFIGTPYKNSNLR
ncbi:MAG: SGNH/GDSL hydrolase family protein [Clostridia bacterium]|nr:SGNH/GDSL hydrolase family protein [Clostridia bacterium]